MELSARAVDRRQREMICGRRRQHQCGADKGVGHASRVAQPSSSRREGGHPTSATTSSTCRTAYTWRCPPASEESRPSSAARSAWRRATSTGVLAARMSLWASLLAGHSNVEGARRDASMQLHAPRKSSRRPCRYSSCRPKGGPRRRHVPSHWAHARESAASRRGTSHYRSRQRRVGALVNGDRGSSSGLKGSNGLRWRRAARNGRRSQCSSHGQIRGRDLALKALRCRRGHGSRPCRPRKHSDPLLRSRRKCHVAGRFRRERDSR